VSKQTVTVVPGDNLWNIAKHKLGAGHRWPEIYALNRDKIKNPNLIQIGQVLALPDASRHGASDPHPMQRARPRIAPLSSNTMASHPTADRGQPITKQSDPAAQTLVNNVAIKIDLSLLPPVVVAVPGAKIKLSWTGQIYLWRDGVRPLNTVGNRGVELAEKHHAATIVGDLVESKKLTIGPDRRITYEDLIGTLTYGSSNTMISSGFTITSSSPVPTYRTQIKTKLRQGKFRDWLFVAEDMTINFDVELDPQQPLQPPLAQTVPAPALQRVPTPAPVPYPGHITADVGGKPSVLQQVGHWTAAHKGEIALAALVTATVVLGFLTLGGSTLVEAGAVAAAAAL
jgi:LysM repeat protein